jgi:V/A-type H+-transporting ATPase subunit C
MDYGYINARIRGMHSRLFDRKAYDALIIRQDIPSIITELEKTPYKKEIEEASILYSGINAIEYALRKNLIRTYQKILGLVRGDLAEKYILIFLNKWDVQNIKTILRGKNIHASHDEIKECLIPAGELDEVTLSELLKQPDVRSVVDLLATWEQPYALPLTDYIDEYSENRDLVILEYALDKFYYQRALEAVKGKSIEEQIVRRRIKKEIDAHNIKSIIRIINDNVEWEDARNLFLEGGLRIDEERFEKMVETGNLREALKYLDGTPYYFLSSLPEEALETGRISVFEKELDSYIISNGTDTYNQDPLSIGIIIGYIWAKYSEIINIRIIARCKHAGVSDEDLEAELIHV